MVDFKKMLDKKKEKGEFLGSCCYCPFTSIYEIDILPSYKDLPKKLQKVICPKCNRYQLIGDLIPF